MVALKVDKIMILGDIVFWGQEPLLCYKRIRELDPIVWIQGNTDDWFNEINEEFKPTDAKESKIFEEFKRIKTFFDDEIINHIKNLPDQQAIRIEGKHILCVHGSDRMKNEPVGIMMPQEELKKLFERINYEILLCAHTHKSYIASDIGKTIINVGSVGLSINKGRAEYALLRIEAGSIGYEIRSISID
jgi:putative phosphoesterase